MYWIIEIESLIDGEPEPAFLGKSSGGVRTYDNKSTAERVAEANDGRTIEIPGDVADLMNNVFDENPGEE
jgi:hypothetical protein